MKKMMMYIAEDGMIFDNAPQCKAHEIHIAEHKRKWDDDDLTRKRLVESARRGMENVNGEINFLKSRAKANNTLSYLTQKMIQSRSAYKRVLKRTNFSVNDMLALDAVLHDTCKTYVAWKAAVSRLDALREQFVVARDGYQMARDGVKR